MKIKEIIRHLEDLKGYCGYTKGFEYNKDIEALEVAIKAVRTYNRRKFELIEGLMILLFSMAIGGAFIYLVQLVYK